MLPSTTYRAAAFVEAARRIGRILQMPDVPREGADALLVEAFVPGPEVALEGLLDGGRLQVLALFDKPDPLDGPFFEETIYVTPSRLSEEAQQAIADCSQAAARALGLTSGPVHGELRFNERGPWLIELAARPIGGRCGAVLRFGVDAEPLSLEALHLHQALGMPTAGVTREPRAAAVMMIPVPRGGTLRELRGIEAARAVAHVEDVVITAHRGQELVPLPEGASYPGFIFARAADPETAVRAVRAAHAHLAFDLT